MNTEAILEAAVNEAGRGGDVYNRELPPRWDWEPDTIAALNRYTVAVAAFEEAWQILEDKIEEHRHARSTDEINRRNAARDGKKDPGTTATETTARELEFATFTAQAKRAEADHSFPEQIVQADVTRNMDAHVATLRDRIESAARAHEDAVAKAQALIGRAESTLNGLAHEMSWLGNHQSTVRFAVGDGYMDTVWPSPTATTRVGNWLMNLDVIDQAAQPVA